jgi:acetyltransferase
VEPIGKRNCAVQRSVVSRRGFNPGGRVDIRQVDTNQNVHPGVAIERLIEVLIRFSYLVAASPEIQEFDINPLLATPDGVVALDARAVRDSQYVMEAARPYAHLAIRPYPEGFERPAVLKDGTRVLLRPIRPEDEPLWHALISSCSLESIRARFRYSFKEATHQMASRFCFIDYDREMAIVAEVGERDQRRLAGVGRLVADPSHETAEFAILVGDAWQGQWLGVRLTESCLEIARNWGLQTVVATTERSNDRMLATFRHFGFELSDDSEERVVRAAKQLDLACRSAV